MTGAERDAAREACIARCPNLRPEPCDDCPLIPFLAGDGEPPRDDPAVRVVTG